MGSIYEQALSTLSWLGEGTADTNLAIIESFSARQINTRDEAIAVAAATFGNPRAFGPGAWKGLGEFLCPAILITVMDHSRDCHESRSSEYCSRRLSHPVAIGGNCH